MLDYTNEFRASTDVSESEGVQRAIDAAAAVKQSLSFPAGLFGPFHKTLRNGTGPEGQPQPIVGFHGVDPGETILTMRGATPDQGWLMLVNGADGRGPFANIFFQGDGKNGDHPDRTGTTGGIFATKGLAFENCRFHGFGGPALAMRNSWWSSLWALDFTWCAGPVLDMDDHNAGVVGILKAGSCYAVGDEPLLRFGGSESSEYRNIFLEGCVTEKGPAIRFERSKKRLSPSMFVLSHMRTEDNRWPTLVEMVNCNHSVIEKLIRVQANVGGDLITIRRTGPKVDAGGVAIRDVWATTNKLNSVVRVYPGCTQPTLTNVKSQLASVHASPWVG